MREKPNRKSPRFFIINPISDRRHETRFESKYQVVIRLHKTDQAVPAIAFDVGQYGLKLDVQHVLEEGTALEVVFTDSAENIHCFGRVVWCKPLAAGQTQEIGMCISDWHGIVNGKNAWQTFKGVRLKQDRRRKIR